MQAGAVRGPAEDAVDPQGCHHSLAHTRPTRCYLVDELGWTFRGAAPFSPARPSQQRHKLLATTARHGSATRAARSFARHQPSSFVFAAERVSSTASALALLIIVCPIPNGVLVYPFARSLLSAAPVQLCRLGYTPTIVPGSLSASQQTCEDQ